MRDGYYRQDQRDVAVGIGCFAMLLTFVTLVAVIVCLALSAWLVS